MGRLEGRRIVVTGAGSGIGRAAALRFAIEGASVAVLDKRAAEAAAVATEIAELGRSALASTCDVSVEADVRAGVAAAAEQFGGVDGLFANAGTGGSGWIHETVLADWDSVLRVHLTGVFLAAKHCLPLMMANGGGSIVTTGSVASAIVAGGSAASYAASKGGVLQLTRQIAVDYAEHNIRANCLCPGAVATDIRKHAAEDRAGAETPPAELPRRRFAPPLGRVSSPDEQAAAAAFLLSDDASFITGSALFVDGGFTAI